ncbi:MAG: hypothetical protein JWO77_1210 [Ilumatobacteraceae bacterium]|nr:hypothetical protein [Ilumatobacteraceae bacterium]
MDVRKPRHALGLMGLTLLVTVGVPSPAGAAQTCGPFTDPNVPATCFTSSTDTVTVEQPVPGTTTDIETFKTRVIVQSPDGSTFDRTVDAPSDSLRRGQPGDVPSEAADLAGAAEAAAASDGFQTTGTEVSPPQRTLTSSTTSEVVIPDREEVTVQTELITGPDTVRVGPDRSETLTVPAGATLFNTNTRTTECVNVATNTTNTYLTTATITISAVAPAGPTSTTTSSTAPAPAASSGSTDTSSGELARTGSSNGPWTALGISLVLAGAGCLHLSRRSARRERPLPR